MSKFKNTTNLDKLRKHSIDYYDDKKKKRIEADIRMVGDDDAIFNFGKYTGFTIKEIVKQDFQYLEWIYLNLKLKGKIKKLIKNMMEEISLGFGDDNTFCECEESLLYFSMPSPKSYEYIYF